MMNQNLMQAEAQVILDLLRKRDVRVRVTGGYKTPGFHVYQLVMDPMQRKTKLDETLDDMQSLLYAYRAKHKLIDVNDPDVRVVCRTQAQPLALEVNRPRIETLYLEDVQWLAQPFVALAGVSYLTKQGQPLTWNMADPSQPHALVAGSSGSGKSNLLLSLSLSLALGTGPDKLLIYVIDGGNSTLLQLHKLPHTCRLATDAEEAIETVSQVKAMVLDRKARSLDKPVSRCLLVVDELANLMAVMDRPTAEAFQRDLAIIAAEGRKFGVHMLVCTQKPLAEVTGSLAKSNMAVRFVGAMASKIDANTAAGSPGTGAERLAGKGDFIRVVGGNVRRFQVPMVDSSLVIMRKIQARWADTETMSVTRDRPSTIPMQATKRDDVDTIADTIRELWIAGESKNAMAKAAGFKQYAGSWAARIDAAIMRLSSTTGASTTASTHTSEEGISDSSRRSDSKIIRFPRKAG